MNIVFLDIDGVLNTSNVAAVEPDMTFNPAAMANLKRIVDETDAYIVISSSWRFYGPGTTAHDVFKRNMQEYDLGRRIIGNTDDELVEFTTVFGIGLGYVRGAEIGAWLSKNAEKLGVSAFVILDDIKDMGVLNKYLAICDRCDGLTDSVREKAVQILSSGV